MSDRVVWHLSYHLSAVSWYHPRIPEKPPPGTLPRGSVRQEQIKPSHRSVESACSVRYRTRELLCAHLASCLGTWGKGCSPSLGTCSNANRRTRHEAQHKTRDANRGRGGCFRAGGCMGGRRQRVTRPGLIVAEENNRSRVDVRGCTERNVLHVKLGRLNWGTCQSALRGLWRTACLLSVL